MMTACRTLLILSMVLLIFASCDKDYNKPLLDIYIAWEETELLIGDEVYFEVRYYPDGASKNIPKTPVVWSIGDTTIASIDQHGHLVAKYYGTTEVTAQLGGFTAHKRVRVNTIIEVEDAAFQALLNKRFDKNNDGMVEGLEIEDIVGLDISELSTYSKPVSLRGLELFGRLTYLKISAVNISYLDLSQFSELKELDISQSIISSLDVSQLNQLKVLDCHACSNLKTLTIGDINEYEPNKLEVLNVARCSISELNLSRCKKLEYIDCSDNNLTSLNLSASPKISQITCDNNKTDYVYIPDINLETLKTLVLDEWTHLIVIPNSEEDEQQD